MIGPRRPRCKALFRRTGAGDDGGAQYLSRLDRRQPHATARTMHQQDFAGFKRRPAHQRHISRQIGGNETRRLIP